MAKFTFNMPDIGEGIAEAEIVQWHKQVGDQISNKTGLSVWWHNIFRDVVLAHRLLLPAFCRLIYCLRRLVLWFHFSNPV